MARKVFAAPKKHPGRLTDFAFSGKNEAAQRTAALNAAKMVKNISNETREAIRATIVRSIRDGIPPRDAAKIIQGNLGLNTKQAQAVMNYRATLVKTGLPLAKIEAKVQKYADKKLKERAKLITRTETMAALNQGRIAAAEQAIQEGYLSPQALKEFQATPDEKLCEFCAPFDEQKVPIKEMFRANDREINLPPVHPRCRCSVAILPPEIPKEFQAQQEIMGVSEPAPVPYGEDVLQKYPTAQLSGQFTDEEVQGVRAELQRQGRLNPDGTRATSLTGTPIVESVSSEGVVGTLGKTDLELTASKVKVDKVAQTAWEDSLTLKERWAFEDFTSQSFAELREFHVLGKNSKTDFVVDVRKLKSFLSSGGQIKDSKGILLDKLPKTPGKYTLIERNGTETVMKFDGDFFRQSVHISDMATAMDTAMSRAPQVSGTYYRGVDPAKVDDVLQTYKIGSVVELETTGSYSELGSVAKKFAVEKGDLKPDIEKNVIFRVKGQSGRSIAELSMDTEGKSFRTQREILLPRGTKLKVVKVSESKGMIVVDMVEI